MTAARGSTARAPDWSVVLGAPPLAYEANSGGPRSRSRVEHLSATVLGDDDGPIRCAWVLRVGLEFGHDDPLAVVRDLVRDCGYDDEEEARRAVALPAAACICRPVTIAGPPSVASLPPDTALFQALVLGLCTPWQYDPRRPLLWTRTSLRRHLSLFEGQGFYA